MLDRGALRVMMEEQARGDDSFARYRPAVTSLRNEVPADNVDAVVAFINDLVMIESTDVGRWIPFELWPARLDPTGSGRMSPSQEDAVRTVFLNGRVAILKARQLGLTWLCLAIALWNIVFIPGWKGMFFSLREKEAVSLLWRLKGMFDQLPRAIRSHLRLSKSNDTWWQFANETSVRAFSTDSGDSYQANFVLVDEATLVPKLDRLLGRVEPCVDSVATGQVALISRANKDEPKNVFNRIYLGAREAGESGEWRGWMRLFLPWWLDPKRGADFYRVERSKAEASLGHYDNLHAMYPSDSAEALAPSTANKRILRDWVLAVYEELPRLESALPVPGLRVWIEPVEGRRYVVGVDAAEGLPTSDNSAIVVVDAETGEEVANAVGKFTPRDTAGYAALIAEYYNDAAVMVERMNHGHAVILGLQDHDVWLMDGMDDRPGWTSSAQGKLQMYTAAAEVVHGAWYHGRELEQMVESGIDVGEGSLTPVLLHDHDLVLEIMSIESATLRAPSHHHDDRADAWALALAGRSVDYPEGIQRTNWRMY